MHTWTSPSTKEVPIAKFWPRDLLPDQCPTARILSFGYDANFLNFYFLPQPKNVPQGTTVDDHSSELMLSLENLRNASQTVNL